MLFSTEIGYYVISATTVVYLLAVVGSLRREPTLSYKWLRYVLAGISFIRAASALAGVCVFVYDNKMVYTVITAINNFSDIQKYILSVFALTKCIDYVDTAIVVSRNQPIAVQHLCQRLLSVVVWSVSCYISERSGWCLAACAIIDTTTTSISSIVDHIMYYYKQSSQRRYLVDGVIRLVGTIGGVITLWNSYRMVQIVNPLVGMNIKLVMTAYIGMCYMQLNSVLANVRTTIDDIDVTMLITPIMTIIFSPMVTQLDRRPITLTADEKTTWAVGLLGSIVLPVLLCSILLSVIDVDLNSVFSPVAYLRHEAKASGATSGIAAFLPRKDGRVHYDQQGGRMAYYRRLCVVIFRYSAFPVTVYGGVVLCNRMLVCNICPYNIIAWVNVWWIIDGVIKGAFSYVAPAQTPPSDVPKRISRSEVLEGLNRIIASSEAKRRASVGQCLDENVNLEEPLKGAVRRQSAGPEFAGVVD